MEVGHHHLPWVRQRWRWSRRSMDEEVRRRSMDGPLGNGAWMPFGSLKTRQEHLEDTSIRWSRDGPAQLGEERRGTQPRCPWREL